MSLLTLSEWLRCPICFHDLEPRPPLALACEAGHAFDVNKRGYVTLLGPSAGKLHSDTAAMLDERQRFLDTGAYAPLSDVLTEIVAERMPRRVLDVGCGTGYYLSGVLSRCRDVRSLAMDLSPAAVARTARRSASVDGLVADVWSPLPIRDGASDVILNVFAPRNPAEFHRVLAPGGALAVVVPADDHLQELRDAGLLIDVRPGKAEQLRQSLGDLFSLDAEHGIRSTLTLDSVAVAALIGMGPSAHHAAGRALPDASQVTASFRLLLFGRRDAVAS